MAIDVLNLMRFKEVADYGDHPDLAPGVPITGAEAYDRYLDVVHPLVTALGGEFLYRGTGGPWLLGPTDEHWDLVLIGRHTSLEAFQSLLSDPTYAAGAGHRAAALIDSRALLLTPSA